MPTKLPRINITAKRAQMNAWEQARRLLGYTSIAEYTRANNDSVAESLGITIDEKAKNWGAGVADFQRNKKLDSDNNQKGNDHERNVVYHP